LSPVLSTRFAFFDVRRVITITTPDHSRSNKFAGTFPPSHSIVNRVGSVILLAEKRSYELIAAIGTPIKFTRSFPANAVASENVPISTTSLNIFTRNIRATCISINQNNIADQINRARLSLIHCLKTTISSIEAPFNHLIIIKCVIAVIATAPSIALQYFGLRSYSKVKNIRVIYCIKAPKKNATSTDPRIPITIESTFAVLI